MGQQKGTTLGVAWSHFATRLYFPGAEGGRLEQGQASLTGAHTLEDVTLLWFAGTQTGGTFSVGGVSVRQGPGGALGVGMSWPLWTTYDRPFAIDLSAQLGAAYTSLQEDAGSLTAVDVRLGATASRTFQRNLAVWGAARVFGGPLFAHLHDAPEAKVGSDTRHVQLAAGASLAPLPRAWPGLRLSLEGRAISEWGLSASVSLPVP